MRNFKWCLLLLLCGSGFAQDISKWKEIIINTQALDDDAINKINKQLTCLQGLHFSGYYAPASCLLLKYDPKKIIDPTIIYRMLYHLNCEMKITVLK